MQIPEDVKQDRSDHTTAVLQLSSDLLKLVTFGGFVSLLSNLKSEDDFPANTVIIELSELVCVCVCVCVGVYTHSLEVCTMSVVWLCCYNTR